jgi:PAB-dependent poly(A)-specific ribonuclease subunit 2
MESEINSPWYIFNDFMVRNVTEEEALSFPGAWKVRVARQAFE